MSKVAGTQPVPASYTKKAEEPKKVFESDSSSRQEIKLDLEKQEENKKLRQKLLEDLVGKEIAARIVWKDLRFYRVQGEDQMFVDVIDRTTGEVLKTIPEPQMMDRVQKLKQSTGVIVNIHG